MTFIPRNFQDVFNLLNFTGFILSLFRFLYLAAFSGFSYSPLIIIFNFLPAALCAGMMYLMYKRAFIINVYFSFLVLPLVLILVGVYTHDRGVFLYLIPYTIYPFFFLNSKRKILIVFTLISLLFISGLLFEVSRYKPSSLTAHDIALELISFGGALLLTFLSLYSIKFQVWKYQEKVNNQRNLLSRQKIEIEKQKQNLEELNLVKDKLFSIIGHDLRTPIQGMLLLLNTNMDSDESLEQLKDLLPDLKAELKKTSDLFENLLSWAKIQIKEASVSKEKINISTLTSKVANRFSSKAKSKSLHIVNEIGDTFITADENILEIVLHNLISNAIKFSDEEDTISIRGNQVNNFFEIKILDTGIGINPETLLQIQNKTFYSSLGTKNEKGTGLGLIICKDLIEKCDGAFKIESEEGIGTTISISLPQ